MLKKVVLKLLPVLIFLMILQPVIYFLWDWVRTGYYAYSFPMALITLGVILFALLFLRFLTPLLNKASDRLYLVSLLVLFLVTRISWMFFINTVPTSDFQFYITVATSWANGQITQGPGLDAVSGMLFPLILALLFKIFGTALLFPKILNLLLGAVTLWLVYRLALQVFNKPTARWSALFFVLWPTQLMFMGVIGTEHMAMALSTAGLLFAVKGIKQGNHPRRDKALSGVLLALGYDTRPTILLFLASILAIWLVSSKINRRFLASMGLFVVLFAIGHFSVLAVTSLVNRGYLPEGNFALAVNIYSGSNLETFGSYTAEDAEFYSSWPKDQALALSIQYTAERIASATPRQIFNLVAHKNYVFWAWSRYGLYWSTQNVANPGILNNFNYPLVESFEYLYQFFILLAALWGLIMLLKQNYSAGQAILMLLLLAAGLAHIIFVSNSRYIYIFEPALLLIASYGISSQLRTKNERG